MRQIEIPMSYPILGAKELIALLLRAEKLLSTLARGEYKSQELAELATLIMLSNTKAAVTQKRLSELSNVSLAVIKSTLDGGRPKLQNFMGLTFGLREAYAEELYKKGMMIPTSGPDGALFIRLHQYTDRGSLEKLVVQLEQFLTDIRGRNNPETYVSIETKESLIALLENLVSQLKSPLVEVKAISTVKTKLGQFAKAVGAKLEGHASDRATNLIIKIITDLFG